MERAITALDIAGLDETARAAQFVWEKYNAAQAVANK